MKTGILLYAFVVLVLPSCAPSIRVFSDFDKDANISDYKTYTWLTKEDIEAKGTNPLYYNELTDLCYY